MPLWARKYRSQSQSYAAHPDSAPFPPISPIYSAPNSSSREAAHQHKIAIPANAAPDSDRIQVLTRVCLEDLANSTPTDDNDPREDHLHPLDASAFPPPDYSSLAPIPPRYPILPREEEGSETLPFYSQSIYKEGFVQRKLELFTPFLPSTQRSWSPVYVQLNNTQLNIFSLIPKKMSSLSPAPPLTIGSDPAATRNTANPSDAAFPSAPLSFDIPSQTPHGPAPLLAQLNRSCNSQQHSATPPSFSHTPASASMHAPPNSTPYQNHLADVAHGLQINPQYKIGRLIKSYTLQYAEVGGAFDYSKRVCVLRVRAEAEQFLIQLESVFDCVTWANALQMGIDIALPLDERPLPRHKLLPRRNRRHRRRHLTTATIPATATTVAPPPNPAPVPRRSRLNSISSLLSQNSSHGASGNSTIAAQNLIPERNNHASLSSSSLVDPSGQRPASRFSRLVSRIQNRSSSFSTPAPAVFKPVIAAAGGSTASTAATTSTIFTTTPPLLPHHDSQSDTTSTPSAHATPAASAGRRPDTFTAPGALQELPISEGSPTHALVVQQQSPAVDGDLTQADLDQRGCADRNTIAFDASGSDFSNQSSESLLGPVGGAGASSSASSAVSLTSLAGLTATAKPVNQSSEFSFLLQQEREDERAGSSLNSEDEIDLINHYELSSVSSSTGDESYESCVSFDSQESQENGRNNTIMPFLLPNIPGTPVFSQLREQFCLSPADSDRFDILHSVPATATATATVTRVSTPVLERNQEQTSIGSGASTPTSANTMTSSMTSMTSSSNDGDEHQKQEETTHAESPRSRVNSAMLSEGSEGLIEDDELAEYEEDDDSNEDDDDLYGRPSAFSSSPSIAQPSSSFSSYRRPSTFSYPSHYWPTDDSTSDTNSTRDASDSGTGKWAPDHTKESLKLIFRCLQPLPAQASWIDKMIVVDGKKYIVKADSFVGVPLCY